MDSFQFLTAKPMLIVWNIGEEDASEASALEEYLNSRYSRPGVEVVVLCGTLEMDLTEMDEHEGRGVS